MPEPLSSPQAYQAFIYALPERYASIRRSTLVYVPSGTLFGRVKGMLILDVHSLLFLEVQRFQRFQHALLPSCPPASCLLPSVI